MDEAPESEYTQEQITSLSWVLETDISDISFTRHSLHSPWKEKNKLHNSSQNYDWQSKH